jgi:hypothetical protein
MGRSNTSVGHGRAKRRGLALLLGVSALLASCASPVPSGVTPTTVPYEPGDYPDVVLRTIAGCSTHPRDHFLNASNVDELPVHPMSDTWVEFLGGDATPLEQPPSSKTFVTDGGVVLRGGMPINVVDSRTTPRSKVVFNTAYSTSSYTGGYPIPLRPLVQGHPGVAWDRHVLILDTADCNAYEIIGYEPLAYEAFGVHTGLVGVRYRLDTVAQPRFTTNAARTPMMGQYLMHDEVANGRVDHPIGFCSDRIGTGFIWPARNSDGLVRSTDAMPMGAWLRLRGDVDIEQFTGQARTIVEALREHGTLLTDTCGGRFALLAENSVNWIDAETAQLRALRASDFEVVDVTPMKVSDDSFQIR